MAGATGKSNPSAQKLDHKELARLQRQDHWIQVTRLKLLMDLIFVCECYIFDTMWACLHCLATAYDVFGLKRAKGQVQTFAGLASAILRSV